MASISISKAPKFSPLLIEVMKRRMLAITTKRLNISKHLPDNLHEDMTKKRAAILVTICNRYDQPSILLTVRSENVGTHRGQVSFPGGHIEPGETEVAAALRETAEELGNGLGSIDIIGECQTVPAVTGTLVTPIVGFISRDVGDLNHIQFNTREVDRVFTRSIDLLSSPTYQSFEKLDRLGKTYTMPVYGKDEGRERIWGLTAMVLHGVMKNLILPSLLDYNNYNINSPKS